MIYDKFDEIGKSNIKATKTDFTTTTGVEGMKDIIRKVLVGGNVRDTTEFITQRRLLASYAAIIELFANSLAEKTQDPHSGSVLCYRIHCSIHLARTVCGQRGYASAKI
jgi:hypothetical protein